VVLSDRDDRAILTLPGAIPTLTAAEVRNAIDGAEQRGVRHVHVASLFLQPTLASELPDLLAHARRRGLTTSLDTNDDPNGRWSGVHALLPHLDVFLPNRAEVLAIHRDDDPRRAACELARTGPMVVVKDGAEGAFAATPTGELVATAGRPKKAVDTTGAGDTFDAAFLDGWLDQLPLAECLDRAALAGSFAVSALGGTAGQPHRDDLQRGQTP
jgi:sugar/nucleoside kinase (ribokinase family)